MLLSLDLWSNFTQFTNLSFPSSSKVTCSTDSRSICKSFWSRAFLSPLSLGCCHFNVEAKQLEGVKSVGSIGPFQWLVELAASRILGRHLQESIVSRGGQSNAVKLLSDRLWLSCFGLVWFGFWFDFFFHGSLKGIIVMGSLPFVWSPTIKWKLGNR